MRRDPRAPLFDVLRAAERLDAFIGTQTFSQYAADELVQAAVERQFEIIGEALSRLQKIDPGLLVDIREHRRIIDFRNLLIHGYDEIDDTIVWSIYVEKLPQLILDVKALLQRINDATDLS